MRRKPHWVSGRARPARCDNFRLIQRLTHRRNGGMAWARGIRLPMTSRAPVCSAHCRRAGKSAGSCWPSPSSVTAQAKPSFSRWEKPVWRDAPLPQLCSWRRTSAPASLALRAVWSDEPSSTTATVASCCRKAKTKGAMEFSSLRQGMTAAQVMQSVYSRRKIQKT